VALLQGHIWLLERTDGFLVDGLVHSPSPGQGGSAKDILRAAGPRDAWQWGMSFFHFHSLPIQNKKQKFLTVKPVFQTLSCLV
jgi:hypothetical protein